MVLGQLDIHMQKNERSTYFTLFTKIYSKSTIDLSVSAKTTIKKMKRQGRGWKKILEKQISDKGPVSKYIKNS